MSTNRDFSSYGADSFVQERMTDDMTWGDFFDIYTQAHDLINSMTEDEKSVVNDYEALLFVHLVLDKVLVLFEES